MSSGKRVKFLDPADIDATIAEVADLVAREHVDAAIVGGVAMMVYGSDRLTKDVDVALVDEYLPGVDRGAHVVVSQALDDLLVAEYEAESFRVRRVSAKRRISCDGEGRGDVSECIITGKP